MTIRNAIPTFGMRSVVALVVLAVAALAALLAVGSPASAQTPTGDEIWSATLTVELQSRWRGYWSTDPVNIGSVTDDEFTAPAGDTRKVQILSHGSTTAFGSVLSQPTIYFSAGPRRAVAEIFSDNELKGMTLHVDGYELEFEDASTTSDFDVGTAYTWPRPSGMSLWTSGQTLAVSITAVPVITIEAVTATVEYGGNSNAAESTAEFKFTRYGSTDEELSFNLLHGGVIGGETKTLKFNAGQSSFSNYHWAVDVDTGGNPKCNITWTVLYGSHYLQGTPQIASVTVEGPGTTCMGGG